MHKRIILSLVTLFLIQTPYAQSWIRINQLGYLPGDIKVAVLVSREKVEADDFRIFDALSGKLLYESKKVRSCGPYASFASSFRLDFSDFTRKGAVYIEAGGSKSPVFNISGNVYDGTADFLLNYMRQQRCGYNPFLHDSCHVHDGYVIYHPEMDSAHIDVTGGWHDATDYLQYTATSANAVFQMLLAYQQNPGVFGDFFLANGEPGKNNIPDIVDEIVWGMEWLIKMNPDSGQMYNQIADDRDHQGFRLPNEDKAGYGKGPERPVYFCTGDTQGIFQYKNRATGIASTAGKYASAFAMGAMVLKDFNPDLGRILKQKATDAWEFGKANPGACQTAPCVSPYFYEEDNWVDDMELAGYTLYALTGERKYLDEAALYGRQEKVTPWMGADTARHYQWYPFLNMGHWGMGISGNPELSDEFRGYWKHGIDNVFRKGTSNPFLYGIPGIWCSNNLTVAMLTQCHLYTKITGDSTYAEMEAALRDWLFGCNPWGTSMIIGLPLFGDSPSDPHSSLSVLKGYRLDGGLVDGPVYNSIFKNLKGLAMAHPDEYEAFQSDVRVYHDDYADYSTNEPTMDGTADLTYYLSAKQAESGNTEESAFKPEMSHGGIIRGNTDEKRIALVFTGHDMADGLKTVSKVLRRQGIRASFFLTGDFYRNPSFTGSVNTLKKEGHYLGGHSDKHLLYCDWSDRDSLLITKSEFVSDLKSNYSAMAAYGIAGAEYFLPPYEWYNDSISAWCMQYGLKLVNFTPGTSSNQDWTYPDPSIKYVSSDTICNRILQVEKESPEGLNGFILLTHFGTDKRRPDKFYNRLNDMIDELKQKGYQFVRIDELLQL